MNTAAIASNWSENQKDDILRLINERAAFPWETLTSLNIPRTQTDQAKVNAFCQRIRTSDRVKPSVKEKTDDELLEHYYLAQSDVLTNLGVLVSETTGLG